MLSGLFDEMGRSFMAFMKRRNFGFVLENVKHRVVGMSYSSSLKSIAQAHTRTIDFLTHQNYFGEAYRLIKALVEKLKEEKAKKLQAYTASTDETRKKILWQCSFKKEASLSKQLQTGSKTSNLEIYCRFLDS
ncbi:unnamed protein product [marine sediment metagenome]|uniref:Uncharacterized protein n=1 Tax=marine sediment metagenome TaxID=412755 RepID=X1GFD4_9ZZZZ